LNLMIDSLPQAGCKVRIEAPLMELSPLEIIKLAQRFGIPFERTRTCVRGRPQPCGRCDPCKSRARAFLEAALIDPLLAAVPNPSPKRERGVFHQPTAS
jgi:7-cyano-7-deazaguanine synthase